MQFLMMGYAWLAAKRFSPTANKKNISRDNSRNPSPPRTEIPGKVSSPPQFFFQFSSSFITSLSTAAPPPPPLPHCSFLATMTRPSPYSSYMVNFPFSIFFFSALYSGPPPSGVFR